jgi:hypothetical protein
LFFFYDFDLAAASDAGAVAALLESAAWFSSPTPEMLPLVAAS